MNLCMWKASCSNESFVMCIATFVVNLIYAEDKIKTTENDANLDLGTVHTMG